MAPNFVSKSCGQTGQILLFKLATLLFLGASTIHTAANVWLLKQAMKLHFAHGHDKLHFAHGHNKLHFAHGHDKLHFAHGRDRELAAIIIAFPLLLYELKAILVSCW